MRSCFSFLCALFTCALVSPHSHADLIFRFVPNQTSGTELHIEGEGTVAENLGRVVNFYNLTGNPFASVFDDTVYILPSLVFGGAAIEKVKLDHDADGDDFFFYFNRSVNAGLEYSISESVVLESLDFNTLTPGIYFDDTDPESRALGGFSLVVESPALPATVAAPSVGLLMVVLLAFCWCRRMLSDANLS